jgi:hypothetical protein
MTETTKRLLALTDIIGLQITCDTCGAALLLNAKNMAELLSLYSHTLTRCTLCKAMWAEQKNILSPSVDEARAFIRALIDLQNAHRRLGFTLSLEITPPSPCRPLASHKSEQGQ